MQHFGNACGRGVNRTSVHHASNGNGRSCGHEGRDPDRFGVFLGASQTPLPSPPSSVSTPAGVASHSTFLAITSCSKTRVLGNGRLPLERVVARCKEAGSTLVTNMWVRDMDLGLPVTDVKTIVGWKWLWTGYCSTV